MFQGYDYDASLIGSNNISPKVKNLKTQSFSLNKTTETVNNTASHLKHNRQNTLTSSHTQNTSNK